MTTLPDEIHQMEAKTRHLEFIQSAINRMANNSFLLKGWSVTLVGGVFALSFKELDRRYLAISLIVLSFFWLLDSVYLAHERRFVKLYNEVGSSVKRTDFSMDTRHLRKKTDWWCAAFSGTEGLFYGGLVVVHLIAIVMI